MVLEALWIAAFEPECVCERLRTALVIRPSRRRFEQTSQACLHRRLRNFVLARPKLQHLKLRQPIITLPLDALRKRNHLRREFLQRQGVDACFNLNRVGCMLAPVNHLQALPVDAELLSSQLLNVPFWACIQLAKCVRHCLLIIDFCLDNLFLFHRTFSHLDSSCDLLTGFNALFDSLGARLNADYLFIDYIDFLWRHY